MTGFIDQIEEDLKKTKDLQIFGEDQKKEGSDFSLIMPTLASLPKVHPTTIHQNKTREYFERSKTGFHVPYNRGIPSINSDAAPSYPFICCVPDSASTHSRSPAEMLVSTEKGSIGPTFKSLDQFDANWLNPKTPSNLVILDAGLATRSSLLKFATERGTKGDLQLEGKPIYEHIATNFSELLYSYLPEGYVVMASSDDLIHFSKVDCQAIHDYFHPAKDRNAPGFFWTEIPNYDEKYLPHTIVDTIRMIQDPAIVELSGTILKQIPILKSVVQAGNIKFILQDLSNTLEKIVPFILEKTSQTLSKISVEEGLIPGYAIIADLYQQLLQYQAAERLNGLKTPFFMIFKKEFLADFKQNILPLLPPSNYLDITWESILIRGIKMDKTIWMYSGRPSAISSKEWANIWEAIQTLKVKHHIKVDCSSQGSLRSAKLKWQNFDDPYSLFLFAKKTYQSRKKMVWNQNKVKMISDRRKRQHQGNIESNLKGTVVLLNSKIEGKIVIEPKRKMDSKNKRFESLFYHVQLPAHSTLHIPPNHLVVGVKGRIFSIKMGMISKEKLKVSSVYLYDQEGHPSFFSSFVEFQKALSQKSLTV
ncbi:MAG: hypothetical protein H0X29_06320 [Parachlamydiaceae bacterium]|nr:hypothetical protein [Parachlamydiaceae bacterium]